MGKHVEHPDNRSIYQPLLATIPVLSLAEEGFLDAQGQRAGEKKPTVLPRWVFEQSGLSLA
jgi:hypothetical protein